jgi:ribosomal protein S27AE
VKKLKRLNKGKNRYVGFDVDEEKPEPKKKKDMCPECGKGELEKVTVVGRTFSRCGICEYRSKTEK